MTSTQLRGTQVLDGSVQRQDVDVSTAGSALIRKALQSTGIVLISTGVDSGTGDVTFGVDPNATFPLFVIVASEALADGAYVNVWNNSGTVNVRNANATAYGKAAHGYVLAPVASGGNATVYFSGVNTHVSGMTGGDVFLQTTAGIGGASPPAGAVGSGNVVQTIGVAISATAVVFRPQITLTQ